MSLIGEIVAAYAAGETGEKIREQFAPRTTPASLAVIMRNARSRLGLPADRCPGRAPSDFVVVRNLSPDVASALAFEASERSVTPDKLVAVLIEILTEDDLFEAVLDGRP